MINTKKHYTVTSDEDRHRFIAVWNLGGNTIKEVSQNVTEYLIES
jgi:hypothetical protein